MRSEILSLKEHIKLLESSLKASESEKGVQYFSVERVKRNDKKLLYYTGISSYDDRALLEFILSSDDVLVTPLKSEFYAENQLFMCLVKLRKDIEYEMLADMFGIPTSTIHTIFEIWIHLLHTKLGINVWPDRDTIIENTPKVFQEKFPNVIGGIDCIEFVVEKPSSTDCDENVTTLKSLILVDPNGAIMFNSAIMTESMSNDQMIVESGFLSTLKEKIEDKEILSGDIIIADNGFTFEGLFKNIPIIVNTQFSKDVQSRKIAAERIQVERVIRRLKEFRILRNIPNTLLDSINKIHSVCCMLTNFKN